MALDPTGTNPACQAWAIGQVTRHCGHSPDEFSLIKARAWSTVWKVSAAARSYYLKACGPGFEREARLLPMLAHEFTGLVPHIVAANAEAGWLLTEDAGRSLHDIIAGDAELGSRHLCAALSAYAAMQFEIAQGRSRVKREHLADHGLEALPIRLQSALDDTGMLRLGGATEHDIARCAGAAERCREACQRLASYGIPHSIEHGDLHPKNIMVDDGSVRVIDWGDAAWSHPFCSMGICLEMSRQAFGKPIPGEDGVIAAYLDGWRSAASPADLRQALALAVALRPIHGALLWARAYDAMEGEARSISAGHAVGWLRAL